MARETKEAGQMTGGMTKRQHDALKFIEAFIEAHGWSPSYSEIASGLGLKSKSGVDRMVTALRERGFISIRRNRARSIMLLQTGKEAQ